MKTRYELLLRDNFHSPDIRYKQGGKIKSIVKAQKGVPEIDGGELDPAVVKPKPVRIVLRTDPITKDTPITHSSLTVPSVSKKDLGFFISKDSDDATYNLFTANCSDATGQCLQDITGVNFTSGITTPIGVSRKVRSIFGNQSGYTESGGGLFKSRIQSFEVPWYDYRKAKDLYKERLLNSLIKKWRTDGITWSEEREDAIRKNWWEQNPKLKYYLDENNNVIKNPQNKKGGIISAQKGKIIKYPTSTTGAFLSGTMDYLLRRDNPKSFIKSEYKPTVGDNGETYYTRDGLKNEVALSLFGGTDSNKQFLGQNYFYKDFDDAYNQLSVHNDSRHTSNGTLGNYAASAGQDNRGRYLSFSDKFDFVLLPGKPIHIYDRIYEDELNQLYDKNDSAVNLGDSISKAPKFKQLKENGGTLKDQKIKPVLKAQSGNVVGVSPILKLIPKKLFELVAKRSNGAQTKSIPTIIGDVVTGRDKSFYSVDNINGSNEIDTYLYGKPYNSEFTGDASAGPDYTKYINTNYPNRKIKTYNTHFGDTLYIDNKAKSLVEKQLNNGEVVGGYMGRYAHAPSYIVTREEGRPYDAGGHLMKFGRDKNGNIVANMSDIYDFLPEDFNDKYNQTENPAWTRNLANNIGTPFIVRQNNIPVRFKEIVPDYKTDKQRQLGDFLSQWGNTYDLKLPLRLTDSQIDEIFDGRDYGDDILDFMISKGYINPQQ